MYRNRENIVVDTVCFLEYIYSKNNSNIVKIIHSKYTASNREFGCKTMKTDSDDSYGFMRLTHTLAVCWGLPITRRKIENTNKHDCDDDSVVRGNSIML